jgi:argininosuccinate lyase
MAVALDNMSVCQETTLKAASDPGMMTTDLVEFLVRNGVPFRQAHEKISQLVSLAREDKKPLSELALSDFQKVAPEFTDEVFKLFDPTGSVGAKCSHGSTGPAQVKAALNEFKDSNLNGARSKTFLLRKSLANPSPSLTPVTPGEFTDIW